jgi:MoxR-like ATPase
LGPVVEAAELLRIQEAVRQQVYVDPLVREYVVAIVQATREHPDAYLGASPRGSLALFRLGQAWAALHGRDYVIPDDVKGLADPALAHRLIVSPAARIKGTTGARIVADVLEQAPVPGVRAREPSHLTGRARAWPHGGGH